MERKSLSLRENASTTCGVPSQKSYDGPATAVRKRVLAPGIPNVERLAHAHNVISTVSATNRLEKRELGNLAGFYNEVTPSASPYLLTVSTKDVGANRVIFGEAMNMVLDTLFPEESKAKAFVIDSDREDSTGLRFLYQKHPKELLPSGTWDAEISLSLLVSALIPTNLVSFDLLCLPADVRL